MPAGAHPAGQAGATGGARRARGERLADPQCGAGAGRVAPDDVQADGGASGDPPGRPDCAGRDRRGAGHPRRRRRALRRRAQDPERSAAALPARSQSVVKRARRHAAGLPAASLQAIEALADQQLSNKNMFYAAEVKGRVTGISTREAVAGTLVGIRSPSLSKGISVPGYHWHFISDDLSFGGHVLGTGLERGVLKLAQVRRLEVELPLNDDFANADQDKDRAAELRKVESAQHDKDGAHKP
ncbi:hypothetical protein F2P46_27715 [Massilia sp. CCM 8734]|nr:hypothetical protein [Massilia sp. CCM 8734]